MWWYGAIFVKTTRKSIVSLLVILLLVGGFLGLTSTVCAHAEEVDGALQGDHVVLGGKSVKPAQPAAQDDVESDSQQDSRLQQRDISDEEVPLAASSETDTLPAVETDTGSWAVLNPILSSIGLMEAFVIIGSFFYLNRKEPLFLFCGNFLLRMLVLFIALISLIGTSIVSDFSQPIVIVDQMSIVIVVLFVAQQALLFSIQKVAPVVQGGIQSRADANKRFRAKKRFETRDSRD
jgi:hypothetical protein